jgi:hypothetical protein
MINYVVASVAILFLGALGYFCYVYLGAGPLEVGVPTKLPAVLEVVSAQTPVLSEVPAASSASVVSQKVEAEVLLSEFTPAVLEVVKAQTSVLSEVPAASSASVLSQKVESAVLLSELSPAVESIAFDDVQRSA